MNFLVPDKIYTLNGVTVYQKLLPDGEKWKDPEKAKAAGFEPDDLYKANRPLSGDGRARGVTIHNTDKIRVPEGTTMAEQYVRATFNENMRSARVHFYVCDTCAWQELRTDEVGWHAGDGKGDGNGTTLSLELIMSGEKDEYNARTRDNGARIAAALLYENGLTPDDLYTHTYFINQKNGFTSPDRREQNTHHIEGIFKYCPLYILRDSWDGFEALVRTYFDALSAGK